MNIRLNLTSIAGIVLISSLSACGGVEKMRDMVDTKEPPIPGQESSVGNRFTVLGTAADIEPDSDIADSAMDIPPAIENISWPQRGANPSNALGAVKIEGLEEQDSASIGEGEEWTTILVTQPVAADEMVYAMDAKGFISAHSADDIDDVLWVSAAATTNDEEEVLGGGLVIAGERLYAATGQGDVLGLSAKDGTAVWKRNLATPIRSAPKLHRGVLYLITVDDQITALDTATGNVLWRHRGLGERESFLSAVSPAIGENLVVAAYSSGEMYGLASDTGQEIWNDSLALTRKTSATSVFTGFEGDPVVAGGVAFASSSNGLTAATHLLSGRRLWEREISSSGTPWLAGSYLFIVTTDGQLVAVQARSGKVKWVQTLPRFTDEDDKEGVIHWFGPYLLGEQLAIFGSHGNMRLYAPQDGKLIAKRDIPDQLGAAPIIANKVVYLVTQDAELHALK